MPFAIFARRRRLNCRARGHLPSGQPVWNDPHFFATCACCKAEIIRHASGEWSDLPSGYRVVWRPRRPAPDDLRAATSLVVWEGRGLGARLID